MSTGSDYRRVLAEIGRERGLPLPAAFDIPEEVVQVAGTRLAYRRFGADRQPSVLFLHGVAQTAHVWDLVALSLADRWPSVAANLRGHGGSDWSADGDYRPDRLALDLLGLVEALGLAPVVVVGLSLGGQVALRMATRQPRSVRAVALVDTLLEPAGVGIPAAAMRLGSRLRELPVLDSVEEFVQMAHSDNPRRDLDKLRVTIRNNLRQLDDGRWTWHYDPRLFSGGLRDAAPSLMWTEAGRLRCPALVVRGAESDLISAESAAAAAWQLSAGPVATIPRAGHSVPGDNPAALADTLQNWLRGLDRQQERSEL
jgi:pimeloyl-ACP methyl ester carboxylesterase